MNCILTSVECWPKSAFPWDLCTVLPGFSWITILKPSLSGLLLKMDLLVWCLCMHGCVCFLSSSLSVNFSHPSHPPCSKTGTNLCGLGGGDSFQQRLTVLSLLCVPLITVAPTKAPGLRHGLPVMVHQPMVSCLGKSPNLPFPPCSSLHLSFCACTWAATAGWWARAALAVWLLSHCPIKTGLFNE